MDNFWLLVIASIGSLITGAIFFAIIYSIITGAWDFLKIKRKLPKDKKKVSEYVKANKEFFKSEKIEEYTRKEEQEDDKRRFEKFREFEKLRRTGFSKTGNSGKGTSIKPNDSNPELQRRGVLQNEPNPINDEPSRREQNIEREVRLDN
jgi:hypothetical protein